MRFATEMELLLNDSIVEHTIGRRTTYVVMAYDKLRQEVLAMEKENIELKSKLEKANEPSTLQQPVGRVGDAGGTVPPVVEAGGSVPT